MFPSQVEVKDKRLRTRNYLGVTKEDANFEVEGDIKHSQRDSNPRRRRERAVS